MRDTCPLTTTTTATTTTTTATKLSVGPRCRRLAVKKRELLNPFFKNEMIVCSFLLRKKTVCYLILNWNQFRSIFCKPVEESVS